MCDNHITSDFQRWFWWVSQELNVNMYLSLGFSKVAASLIFCLKYSQASSSRAMSVGTGGRRWTRWKKNCFYSCCPTHSISKFKSFQCDQILPSLISLLALNGNRDNKYKDRHSQMMCLFCFDLRSRHRYQYFKLFHCWTSGKFILLGIALWWNLCFFFSKWEKGDYQRASGKGKYIWFLD